jgi:hypothetical protein
VSDRATVGVDVKAESAEIDAAEAKLVALKARLMSLGEENLTGPQKALRRLREEVSETDKAIAKLKGDQKSAADKLKRDLEGSIAGRHAALTKGLSFDSLFGGSDKLASAGNLVGKIFGAGAKGSFEAGLGKLAGALDGTGLTPGMLTSAAGALGTAFKIGGEVALALTAAAAALGGALLKYGTEETAKRQRTDAALGARGVEGGHEFVVDLAAKYSLDEGDALTQVKKLLNADFSQAQIPALIRIKAGMDEAGFDGSALLERLERMKLGSKIGTKDVEGLKKLGIDVNAVYAQLAKDTGQSMDVVKAKVKSGTLDSAQAIDAITKVAGGRFGPLADMLGGDVLGLFNKLRLGVKGFFDGMDLGPIGGFLKSLLGALGGGAGSEVKDAASNLFSAISHSLFDSFQGPEGQAKLENMLRVVAQLLRDAADTAREMAPAFRFAAEAMSYLGDSAGTGRAALEGIKAAVWPLLMPIHLLIDDLRSLGTLLGMSSGPKAGKPATFDGRRSLFQPEAANDNAGAAGEGTGADFASGFAQGIAGGQSGAVMAAVMMVRSAVDAARTEADAHSPSRKLLALGKVGFGGGLAGGMDQAQNDVARAGADMAGAGVDGAASGIAPHGSAQGQQSGRGPVTIIVNVNGAGDNAQDIAAEVRRQLVLLLRDYGIEAA